MAVPLPPIPDVERLEELAELLPGLEPEAVRLVAVLRDVARRIDRAAERDLAPSGLSEGRLRVLTKLKVAGGAVPHARVAEDVGVRAATLTGLVDGLVREDLVRRVDDPDDRRRVLLELTRKGRNLLARVLPPHLAGIRRVIEPLSAPERARLAELLEKVRQATTTWSESND